MRRAALIGILSLTALAPSGALGQSPRRFELGDLAKLVNLISPQLSPDGRSVVVVVSRPNYSENRNDTELVLIDVRTGRQHVRLFMDGPASRASAGFRREDVISQPPPSYLTSLHSVLARDVPSSIRTCTPFPMTLSQELTAFIRAAVQLPEDRLRRIDRAWERLQPHRTVVAGLVQGNQELSDQVRALREYVMAEARRSAAERRNEDLIPEDMAEAILPTARALLLRKLLENSSDQKRAHAFTALTKPFADILPST
jgi:hypothetical protein